jgi:hypothetical protein
MGKILKGIGIIIGFFIFLALLGAMFGSNDPTAPDDINSDTKTAYTQDGKNFVSKERMDENIKYGYAKVGDYKKVQVPLNTVVVGASVIPDEPSKGEDQTKTPEQSTSTTLKETQITSNEDFSQEKVTQESAKDAIRDALSGNDYTVSVNEISSPDDMNIIIKVAPWDTWNTEGFVHGTADDAAKVFSILFSNPTVERVYYWQDQNFIDKYGNKEISKAIAFDMTKETANKIKWDNFINERMLIDYKSLFNVVDGSYIHPAIQKEIQ